MTVEAVYLGIKALAGSLSFYPAADTAPSVSLSTKESLISSIDSKPSSKSSY